MLPKALLDSKALAAKVYLDEKLKDYILNIIFTSRFPEKKGLGDLKNYIQVGASPRATLHLVRAAKATAAISGRDYVLPDDVLGLAPSVLTHRLLPSVEAAMSGRTTGSILESILASVPVPEGTRA